MALAMIVFFFPDSAACQKYIWGVVVDSISESPLAYVNVFNKKGGKGVLTDENGFFRISLSVPTEVTVKCMGYQPKTVHIRGIGADTLKIRLLEESYTLDEVVVKHKRAKYSKKNNPAVDLMQSIRANIDRTDPRKESRYSYDKYEKTLIAGEDFNMNFGSDSKIGKDYGFLSQYIDTALWTGKPILDLSLLEKTATRSFSKDDRTDKEIVTGMKEGGINELIDGGNFRPMIEDVMREIDITNDDISLMQNRFVSPLSKIAADFYMFHITDTLQVSGERCIELSFAPKTPETFGFNGKLYVPLEDTIKYVKRVSMRVPKAINVNYVDNIFISQNYERDSLGNVHKVLDDLCLELRIINAIPTIYGSRQTRYYNFSYDDREEFKNFESVTGHEFKTEDASLKSASYWESVRRIPLSSAEMRMADLIPSLRREKLFYWGEKILRPLIQGYVGTLPKNSKFNIGPVNTFISFNDVEGLRLKAGGMSTAHLSKHFFFRGYVAYGCKDHRWKYNIEAEYSFIKKKMHSREFPLNSIRATYQYDTEQIGVRYLYSNPDNIILSVKRMRNDLYTYRRFASIEYNLELLNNLSFNLGYQHSQRESTLWIKFIDGFDHAIQKFDLGSFFIKLRYAPGEKFVQGTTNRAPINMDAPIFTLTQEYGPKHFLGADFVMSKTEFSFKKRFWLSAFGYINTLLKTGKIWSQVPFPALLWQNANLSYTIQQESFALLNPMEFALDQFVSWDFEYFISGAIFNRIPLIRKAKLREVLTFKGFWGSLTRKNNPVYNPQLFIFPQDSFTHLMGKDPYMEVSVGIDNIFTLLRLDYVWRLTYRHTPGVDKQGLRVSLHLSF